MAMNRFTSLILYPPSKGKPKLFRQPVLRKIVAYGLQFNPLPFPRSHPDA